jgi:hypothetical protein
MGPASRAVRGPFRTLVSSGRGTARPNYLIEGGNRPRKETNCAHTLKKIRSPRRSGGRSFFDKLDKEIVAGGGILNNEPALGEAAGNMLARRDEIVTMLARGDRAASGVLAGWYFELEQVTNGEK